ncbi:uncharacterized protein LOC134814163 [Bolinopsis microptera]|uniref:uncharacterized protein LOC134814163 n=1 Tax=Bolinopsis microptera TaxID=2820187 RepID=UPI003079A13F
MATLRAEQAVSRERATQVNELMGIKTGLETQLSTLQSALKSDNSHLLKQLAQQHQQDQDTRDELVRYYKSAEQELVRRLDHVVNEHSQCHNMRRKVQSLKQQLAVEKTAQNPNTELAQKVETSAVQIQSLEKQVNNLERANTKLESSATKLMEENADLVERLNNTEHQIHLALQETIKTKSQKVAICKVLENVVNVVTTAA